MRRERKKKKLFSHYHRVNYLVKIYTGWCPPEKCLRKLWSNWQHKKPAPDCFQHCMLMQNMRVKGCPHPSHMCLLLYGSFHHSFIFPHSPPTFSSHDPCYNILAMVFSLSFWIPVWILWLSILLMCPNDISIFPSTLFNCLTSWSRVTQLVKKSPASMVRSC